MHVKKDTSRLPASYWRLFLATGIDNVGTGAYVAAVPLLAVSLSRDPRLVTAISTAAFLPWLLVSLPAGALIDRCERVVLMWRTQLVAATIMAVTTTLVASDQISIVVLASLAFGLGTCDVLFGNAAQAVLPRLVPTASLHKANGNQQAMITAGQQFVGPPVGSSLFAVVPALPFGINAVSFLISASLLRRLPKEDTPESEAPPMRTAITSGLKWLKHHRLMRTLAVLLGVNSFSGQMANAILVLIVTDDLGVTAGGYGLLLAAAAAGSVLGGVVNAHIVHHIGSLPALVSGLTLNILALAGVALSPSALVLGCFLAVNGFATTMWNVVTTTLRQQLVPPEMLGRVTSIYKLLGWGLIPVGTLTGGLSAHSFGIRVPYALAGLIRTIALGVALPALISTMRAQKVR
ncbi:MFS transporter [Amycolatopsis umgeniensis]|uniref:MFS family permease n=1 Tax=Amycolatopsis umgeniensis TaxID=336628 RepID=A0A841ARH5_9PSEU|nr:MFS transporter [Amycolatopsis umgeniensis]MBB5850496.1 MFS family permease [Amycolatopsis umgeniensis]